MTTAGAGSGVAVGADGTFEITAAGYTWGVPAGDPTNKFQVANDGTTVLNANGKATLRGDFLNRALTQLNLGLLDLGGKAVQQSGTFELNNNTTVIPSAPERVLRIYDGTIKG